MVFSLLSVDTKTFNRASIFYSIFNDNIQLTVAAMVTAEIFSVASS